MRDVQAESQAVLILAIVQYRDSADLMSALVERGYRATQLNSWGGWLGEGNVIVLVGVREDQASGVAKAISGVCQTRTVYLPGVPIGDPAVSRTALPIEAVVGGAVVFVLPVERWVALGEGQEADLFAGLAAS